MSTPGVSAGPAAVQKQERRPPHRRETSRAQLERGCSAQGVRPAGHLGPLSLEACLQAVETWAQCIMQMPRQGLPGQSDALSGQRSTCWVVGWEGLGRKRLDWCEGPPGRG